MVRTSTLKIITKAYEIDMGHALPRPTMNSDISDVSKSYFARRVDSKLTDLDEISKQNQEQATRIETAFTDHMCRQVRLVDDIKDSIDYFKTTIEKAIDDELNKIKAMTAVVTPRRKGHSK